MTVLGYCTENMDFQILTDKDIARYDFLCYLNRDKGECDWDPNHGVSVRKKMFQIKTPEVRNDIIEDIKYAIEQNPLLSMLDIQTTELNKGWQFALVVSYLNNTPEEWILPVTEDTSKSGLSIGVFPLGTYTNA